MKRMILAAAALALVLAAAAPAIAFVPEKGAEGLHKAYGMSGGKAGMAKVCTFCHG